MGDRIHALAQQLTGNDRLEECSIEELRHIANRHPYFAPAQFLLLQRLRQSGPPEEADAQYRKAVLYYHDPLLFEQFIASNKFYTEALQTEPVSENVVFNEESVSAKTGSPEVEEQVVSGDPIKEINIAENNTNQEAVQSNLPEEVEQPVLVTESDDAVAESTETVVHDEPLAEIAENNQAHVAEESVYERQDIEKSNDLIPLPISTLLTEEKSADQVLAFEPFHTVDYFASQGIKVSQEEAPKDKLGKQLKSFTEWLKTMKRLPATQAAQNVESFAEKKVESLADRSVSESDVVTEAMAEVWLKQGNTDKALDIYNKLSLLNPSKKAYFVAKIENLKQS